MSKYGSPAKQQRYNYRSMYRKAMERAEAHTVHINDLELRLDEAIRALKAVVSVADRNTVEFDAARKVIAANDAPLRADDHEIPDGHSCDVMGCPSGGMGDHIIEPWLRKAAAALGTK